MFIRGKTSAVPCEIRFRRRALKFMFEKQLEPVHQYAQLQTALGVVRQVNLVEKNRAKLQAYEDLCAQLGEEPAQVALAWLLSNPVVTAPIIGPRTPEQLDRTLRALEIPMSKEMLEKLDEIFPGPGGPAPEGYAW